MISTIQYDISYTIAYTNPPVVAAEHEVVQRRGHLIPVLLHELRGIIDNLPRKMHHPKRSLRSPQVTTTDPAERGFPNKWRVNEYQVYQVIHAACEVKVEYLTADARTAVVTSFLRIKEVW